MSERNPKLFNYSMPKNLIKYFGEDLDKYLPLDYDLEDKEELEELRKSLFELFNKISKVVDGEFIYRAINIGKEENIIEIIKENKDQSNYHWSMDLENANVGYDGDGDGWDEDLEEPNYYIIIFKAILIDPNQIDIKNTVSEWFASSSQAEISILNAKNSLEFIEFCIGRSHKEAKDKIRKGKGIKFNSFKNNSKTILKSGTYKKKLNLRKIEILDEKRIISFDSNIPVPLLINKDNQLSKEIQFELRKTNEIHFLENDHIFERIIKMEEINENGFINPTEEWEDYFRTLYELPKTLKGYYVGDPEEWAVVMIKDGYFDNPEELIIVELAFPEDTIAFSRDRPKSFGEYGNEEMISEYFIVYEYPIKPLSTRRFTPEQIEQINEEVDRWNGNDEDDFNF